MENYFEVKIKYTTAAGTAKLKVVSESYLFNAMSFTEAETKTTLKMNEDLGCDFSITNIKRINYSDVFFNPEREKWYKCRIKMLLTDEYTGIGKYTNQYILIQSNSIDDATVDIKERLKDSIVLFEIVSITETNILDVFPD